MGPYLLFGLGYFYVTLSGLFAAWLFMPLVIFMAALVVTSFKLTTFLRRRVEAPPPALISKITTTGVVGHIRGQLVSACT